MGVGAAIQQALLSDGIDSRASDGLLGGVYRKWRLNLG